MQQGRHKATFAELHIIGEIVGASHFDYPEVFCRWQLVYEPSKSWTVLRGLQQVRRGAPAALSQRAVLGLGLPPWLGRMTLHVACAATARGHGLLGEWPGGHWSGVGCRRPPRGMWRGMMAMPRVRVAMPTAQR